MTDKITVPIIHPKKVLVFLLSIAISLILVNCLVWFLNRTNSQSMAGINRLFNLNTEANIPTTFSVLLLFTVFLLLLLKTWKIRREKKPFFFQWALLTGGFLYICIDEGAAIHEMLVPILAKFVDIGPYGIFTFNWVLVAIIILPILGFIFRKFLFQLPRPILVLFIISGSLYIIGSIGMEMLGGIIAQLYKTKSLEYFLEYTVEESLEMFGVILFLYALLVHSSRDEEIETPTLENTSARP